MKLNLGAGSQPLLGFVNYDLAYPDLAITGDLEVETGVWLRKAAVYPLPEPFTGEVELIRASHVLEHFGHREVGNVLRDWIRCLAPGGILKLAVPDMVAVCGNYLSGVEQPTLAYVYGGQVDENDFHKCGFDEENLRDVLSELGLVDIKRWTSEQADCAALPISLNLQGRKPVEGEEVKPRTVTLGQNDDALEIRSAPHDAGTTEIPRGTLRAVMSCPRLGFLDHHTCALQALVPLGIAPEYGGGAFWCQSLDCMLRRHLDDGTEFILTMDYDTLFERRDIEELHRLMTACPDLDAVAALQMRREGSTPLWFPWVATAAAKAEKILMDANLRETDLMRVATAHFGLTIIRVSSLRKLPEPWFAPQPNADGMWTEGRLDADISFWHAWKEAGLSLWSANRVRIGHLQLMATWPGAGMQPVHQYVSDWQKMGKPAGM